MVPNVGSEAERNSETRHWADAFIGYNRIIVGVIAAVTVSFGACLPHLTVDASLRSVLVTSSAAYGEYEKFLPLFGYDDYILLAITDEHGVDNDRFLKSLRTITEEAARPERVEKVVSLSNLKIFRKKGEQYGNLPIVEEVGGSLTLPEEKELKAMRKALPEIDLLLAGDRKTAGVLFKLSDDARYDVDGIRETMAVIEDIAGKHMVEGSEKRVVGMPIIRQAIPKYSVLSAIIFGLLCGLICTVVTAYVFRGLKVTILTMAILGVCIVWVLGLMTLLDISLNATTSISFGLILITTLEIVIHMFVRFKQFQELVVDRDAAIRATVRYLARPCLVSAATTAVGFGSCMVTPIPMVFQLGLIMSAGVLISYFLTMALTPFVLAVSKGLVFPSTVDTSGDLLSRTLVRLRESVRAHYRLHAAAGVLISVIMLLGTPLVRTDPQLLRQLGEARPEVRDIAVVEQRLTGLHVIELIIDVGQRGGSFKDPEMWVKVGELDARLKRIPEIVGTSSLLPFLQYMASVVGVQAAGEGGIPSSRPALGEILTITSLSSEGRSLLRSRMDGEFEKLRISARIKNSPHVSISQTIGEIRSEAQAVFEGSAEVVVTGETVVIAAQGEELIRSEILALIIAVIVVTALLMIQMGSPLLGLLGLIPNIPPLATVFGVMGWLGIPLDGITIFAATVSLGLAADNTIQFMAQLKREISLNPSLDASDAVFQAYGLAARPMASWSVVTLLGFLALAATPFQAAFHFGVLVSCALCMGIFGDLVLMQSMILAFPSIQRLIGRVMEKGDPQRGVPARD